MVIQTLDALARLDYPDFEVLVIDNNTQGRGGVAPGRGALRRARARASASSTSIRSRASRRARSTSRSSRPRADAEVVGRDRRRLRRAARAGCATWCPRSRTRARRSCRRRRTTATRASAFKAMCHAEYRGFFHIGMVTRNERNAIIQHGTMTLVRRTLLERIGWAEWCITEDAELGLRIFEEGYDATYIPVSYGRGVMPDTFLDFKKQRFALGVRRDADHAPPLRRAGAGPATRGSRRASAITSSPAGCPGSPTASTCCSISPRWPGRWRWWRSRATSSRRW